MTPWGTARNFVSRAYRRATCRIDFRGQGNRLVDAEASLREVEIDVEGDDNSFEFAPGSRAYGVRFEVRGSGHRIRFDAGSAIKDGGFVWFDGDGGTLHVGEQTTIESARFVITEDGSQLVIGRDCMLAYQVEIRTGDSHSVLDAATTQRINPPSSVSIGDHVWIGAHATVLKGVSVGAHSVVATRAVVTRSCAPGVIVAGNPARVVRTDVTWDRRRLPYQRA